MPIYDLKELRPTAGERIMVIHTGEGFNARIISLPTGDGSLSCQMADAVVFVILAGSATIKVDGEEHELKEQQSLITHPASISISTQTGVQILGIQIECK